jgi:hypothetical protein
MQYPDYFLEQVKKFIENHSEGEWFTPSKLKNKNSQTLNDFNQLNNMYQDWLSNTREQNNHTNDWSLWDFSDRLRRPFDRLVADGFLNRRTITKGQRKTYLGVLRPNVVRYEYKLWVNTIAKADKQLDDNHTDLQKAVDRHIKRKQTLTELYRKRSELMRQLANIDECIASNMEM